MPKVTIEFNLPDDRYEYAQHFHAAELFSVCHDINEEFRNQLKHGGELYKTPEEVMHAVRSNLAPILQKLED